MEWLILAIMVLIVIGLGLLWMQASGRRAAAGFADARAEAQRGYDRLGGQVTIRPAGEQPAVGKALIYGGRPRVLAVHGAWARRWCSIRCSTRPGRGTATVWPPMGSWLVAIRDMTSAAVMSAVAILVVAILVVATSVVATSAVATSAVVT